jgi:hypothetical protein
VDSVGRILTPGNWLGLGRNRFLTLVIGVLGLAVGYLASQLVLSGETNSLIFVP